MSNLLITSIDNAADMAEKQERLSKWWNHGSLGRPALLLTMKNPDCSMELTPLPGHIKCRKYTPQDMDIRLEEFEYSIRSTYWFCESLPAVQLYLGPGSMAAYLGSHITEQDDTVWYDECIEDPDTFEFIFDEENPYWIFQQELVRKAVERYRFVYIPDLQSGLDILSAMRGPETLMLDLFDRPEWVRKSVDTINSLFKQYRNRLIKIADRKGVDLFFVFWSPGNQVRLQSDFSFMISNEMFRNFELPGIQELLEEGKYSWYHLDGPGNLKHLDDLISLEMLNVIQWVPGTGNPPNSHKSWFEIYRKILDRGKNIFVYADSFEDIRALKSEFGTHLDRFMIRCNASTLEDAEKIIESSCQKS